METLGLRKVAGGRVRRGPPVSSVLALSRFPGNLTRHSWGWVAACAGQCLGTAGLRADLPAVVQTIEQQRISGDLIRFDLKGELALRRTDGTALSLPVSDLMWIETTQPQQLSAAPFRVLLRGGDSLYGSIIGGSADQIIMNTALGSGLGIRLERVRACLTRTAAQPQWREPVQNLLQSSSEDDRLLLSNGDLMNGFVVGVDDQAVTFEQHERETRVPLDVVIGVTMASDGGTRPPADGAHLEFVDGSVLGVSRLQWSPETLEITFFDGTVQGLPPESVRRIELRGDRWRWLSDQAPDRYAHTPLISLAWPYRLDSSVAGGPLTTGGQTFAHGIGVHSRSVLGYDLGGAYSLFTTWCGLDQSAGPLAHVAVSVIVDGQTRWTGAMTGRTPPQILRIDISGADTLELRVDFGENGDVQDRFDWADAALVR